MGFYPTCRGFDSCRGHIFSLIYDQLFLLFMLCFWGKFTIVSYGHLWPLMVPHVVGLSWDSVFCLGLCR